MNDGKLPFLRCNNDEPAKERDFLERVQRLLLVILDDATKFDEV